MSEKAPIEQLNYDDISEYAADEEWRAELISTAETCVFIHLRRDGHPVGAAVSGVLIDGTIYTLTNLLRLAYKRVLNNDNRVCVVFDSPKRGSVTVMGRAKIIDDPGLIDRFFDIYVKKAPFVVDGTQTAEEFRALAQTPNRRLFEIVPEKTFSVNLLALPQTLDQS